jgi:hypothetical protein
MPTSSTFTNGQTLVSSALSEDDLNKILQALTLNVLGIDPASDTLAYSKVRVGWIAQPAFARTDNVVSITVTEEDGDYNKIRDRKYSANDASSVQQTDTFTRIWEARWQFYGPNGFDHARLLKSALTLSFTHDTLLASRLALVTRFPATTRAPELFEGQWWQRSDLKLSLYELVTETLVVNNITSAEVLVFNAHGQVADVKAPA